MFSFKRFSLSLFLLLLPLFFFTTQPPPIASAVPLEPLDTTPITLVNSGVTGYTIAAPKVFWNTTHPVCPPTDVPANTPADAAALNSELISRTSVYGTETRVLYDEDTGSCNIFNIESNIVADDNYVYWVGPNGLMKLSTDANVGDAPTLMHAGIQMATDGQLILDNDNLYFLKVTGFNPNYTTTIYRISKGATPGSLIETMATRNAYGRKLGVSHAFLLGTGARNYLYWLESGNLIMQNLDDKSIITKVNTNNVVDYYAEGGRVSCTVFCSITDRVYYSNSSNQLWTFNSGGTASLVYTSADQIYDIVTDSDNIYMLESHENPCNPQPCFSSYTGYVTRRPRSGGSTDYLFVSDPQVLTPIPQSLAISDIYLFWQEGDDILRLPSNADALPLTNMRVTGLSITQGIQKSDNSVILIEGRRTFVRVFVKSDGTSVSGVSARLHSVTAGGAVIDTLLPVNDVGTDITVKSSPNRSNLNDSFLFELPWSWINSGLRLRADLNPYHSPPQASYANNSLTSGPFNFQPSPALKVNFVAWQYYNGNTIYSPHLIDDIIHTYSWLIRAYPIASKIVFDNNNEPGLHPNLWFVGDDNLWALVDRSAEECQDLLIKNPNGTVKKDNRNLCASRYTNYRMVDMRADAGLPGNRFFYGMISDAWKFPRGQACCGTAVSSGPVGPPDSSSWDTDATYGDWYAAHEIAHTLGRNHPDPNSDDPATENTVEGCGHSRSDPSYPYANAQIGASVNDEGFDAGDPSLGIPRRIYPGNMWSDVMSYCNNQWVSDYTYTGMYNYMMALQDAPADPQQVVAGDWLVLHGSIVPDNNSAAIQNLSRVDSNANAPALIAGDYLIRLLDSNNATLTDYAFTPEAHEEAGDDILYFHQLVAFTAGTTKVQIVRLNDGTILTEEMVSTNAPVVSNVSLNGVSQPVDGPITLTWDATDADGDTLLYNVLYSTDNGTSFQPVMQGLTDKAAEIDTSMLGGSTTAVLRVIASDGANQGSADSPVFNMASKKPMPMILLPGPDTTIQYGQLVNFSGTAMDYQDGGVSGSDLVWRINGRTTLGTGELLSVDDLPVGENIITLTAINDDGLFETTSITVHVQDELNLLGPTLTAGPTQFGWTFATDATTPQAFALNIGNAGSGDINWSISKDVSWLATDVVTGTNATNVMLTVDPAGLENGSSDMGTLTITVDGLPEQTMDITVSYSKGFIFYNPPTILQYIQLPLIIK